MTIWMHRIKPESKKIRQKRAYRNGIAQCVHCKNRQN